MVIDAEYTKWDTGQYVDLSWLFVAQLLGLQDKELASLQEQVDSGLRIDMEYLQGIHQWLLLIFPHVASWVKDNKPGAEVVGDIIDKLRDIGTLISTGVANCNGGDPAYFLGDGYRYSSDEIVKYLRRGNWRPGILLVDTPEGDPMTFLQDDELWQFYGSIQYITTVPEEHKDAAISEFEELKKELGEKAWQRQEMRDRIRKRMDESKARAAGLPADTDNFDGNIDSIPEL